MENSNMIEYSLGFGFVVQQINWDVVTDALIPACTCKSNEAVKQWEQILHLLQHKKNVTFSVCVRPTVNICRFKPTCSYFIDLSL